jgi:hypothetical protein
MNQAYRYRHKPNIIIADNISERNERSEKLPISREKKIYLYLKNNSNKNVDNVESNIILQNKGLLKFNKVNYYWKMKRKQKNI